MTKANTGRRPPSPRGELAPKLAASGCVAGALIGTLASLEALQAAEPTPLAAARIVIPILGTAVIGTLTGAVTGGVFDGQRKNRADSGKPRQPRAATTSSTITTNHQHTQEAER